MLNLPINIRDEIVRVLQGQIVPAQSGSVLMQIASILSNLKPAEDAKPVEETTPVTPVAPATPVADQNV